MAVHRSRSHSRREHGSRGIQIETTGAIVVRDAYYTLDIDGELTDIELSLSTTTFKKESYITKNIELVKKEILGSDN